MDKIRKLTAGILAFVMLSGVLCSCSSSKDDQEQKLIKAIPEEFLDAVIEEDDIKIKSLSKEYDPESLLLFHDDSEEYNEICKAIIQTATIEDTGTPEIDRKNGSARLTVTVSLLDLDSFYRDNSEYMKYQPTLDALRKYNKFTDTDIELEFIYDDLRDKWFLKSGSARKLHKLIASVNANFPVTVLPEEAEEIVNNYFENLASGVFDESFDWEEFQVYDNTVDSGTGIKAQEATERFISEYFQYILDHDHKLETVDGYKYVLSGWAPSHDELSQVLFKDDFVTGSCMNRISFEEFLLEGDGLWERETELVYNMLTEAVDECSPEEYRATIKVNAYSEAGMEQIPEHDSLIIEPSIGFYQADHGVGWEQLYNCTKKALDTLYENGKIDKGTYDSRIGRLTPENYGYVPDGSISFSGHPNQALGTHEHSPSFDEDGTTIYGYSNPDANGFWMHYSKELLETVSIGYYIDDSGIWIFSTFFEPFEAGTNLSVEWKIDGEDAGSGRITVEQNYSYEIEVHLETDGFPSSPHVYEMRLWSEGREHVYTYVTLTDTN